MAGRFGVGHRFVLAFLVGLIGAVIALIPWVFGLMDTWEAKTWDWRAAMMAKPGSATNDICLILLDQNSLEWGRNENALSWPWPRETYSAVANFCHRNGAKAVAFDVLFEDPSEWGVEDDRVFGQALANFGHAAAAVALDNQAGPNIQWPADIALPGFTVIGLEQWLQRAEGKINLFRRATMPVAEVAQNAAILCNVTQNPDLDGIYRQVKPFNLFDGQVLPSMGVGGYLAAHPHATLQLLPDTLIVDGKSIPVDRSGNVLLKYRGPSGTFKKYSAAAVIQSELQILEGRPPNISDPGAFKDKYVFFGFSAPGLYDLRSTPVAGVFPGAEIYATMLDNFLSGDFMRRSPAGVSVILVLVLTAACAQMASYFRSPAGTVAVSIMAACTPVFLSLIAYAKGFWLPLVVQETAVVAVIGSVLVVNYTTEGRQKRFIKRAFQHFLSPAVIEQIIAHPERLKLGGERKVLSLFFF